VSEQAFEITASAVKDGPTTTSARRDGPSTIHGVEHHELPSVATRSGVTIEAYRGSWSAAMSSLAEFVHVTFRPGAISAWHLHRLRCDGVFVLAGTMRLVLFDARRASPTKGLVDVLELSPSRPALVVIPPAVWHGVQALGAEPMTFLNCFDRAYDHDDPDEWRLPPDSDEVPYRFS
jgi:dTDP-4-dehydrorhamnose 3,5-epimerase